MRRDRPTACADSIPLLQIIPCWLGSREIPLGVLAQKLISIIERQLNGNHSRRVTGNSWPAKDVRPVAASPGLRASSVVALHGPYPQKFTRHLAPEIAPNRLF
jgi:hypothetical protein